jgi:hypothetical protein
MTDLIVNGGKGVEDLRKEVDSLGLVSSLSRLGHCYPLKQIDSVTSDALTGVYRALGYPYIFPAL